MNLFTLLSKKAKKLRLSRSKEYHFFLKYRYLFVIYKSFITYFNIYDEFALTRANIILRGLINKQMIDKFLHKAGEQSIQKHGRIKHHDIRDQFLASIKLPYFFNSQDTTYYIPFFNKAMNWIYGYEPDKVFDYPYNRLLDDFSTSIIDPFEKYHHDLYHSNFTNLVPLHVGDATSKGYYHPDFQTIFIINNQGRLDVKIHLFDRGLKRPNLHHCEERMRRALTYFFANDRQQFIDSLFKEGLISERVYKRVNPKLTTSFIKREYE
jgi:hypothetical protein